MSETEQLLESVQEEMATVNADFAENSLRIDQIETRLNQLQGFKEIIEEGNVDLLPDDVPFESEQDVDERVRALSQERAQLKQSNKQLKNRYQQLETQESVYERAIKSSGE